MALGNRGTGIREVVVSVDTVSLDWLQVSHVSRLASNRRRILNEAEAGKRSGGVGSALISACVKSRS